MIGEMIGFGYLVERGAFGWSSFGRRNEEMEGDFGRVVRARGRI